MLKRQKDKKTKRLSSLFYSKTGIASFAFLSLLMIVSSCSSDIESPATTLRSTDGGSSSGMAVSAVEKHVEDEMNFRHALFNRQCEGYETTRDVLTVAVDGSNEVSATNALSLFNDAKTAATQALAASAFSDPLALVFDMSFDKIENGLAYFDFTTIVGKKTLNTFTPFQFGVGQNFAADGPYNCNNSGNQGAANLVGQMATYNLLGAFNTTNQQIVASNIDVYSYIGDVPTGYPTTLNNSNAYFGWNDYYDSNGDYFTDFNMFGFICGSNCDDFLDASTGQWTAFGADVFCIEFDEMNIYMSNAQSIANACTASFGKDFLHLDVKDKEAFFPFVAWDGEQLVGDLSTRPGGYTYDDLSN